MMLFDSYGNVYRITIPLIDFLSFLTKEQFKEIYFFDFYHFALESTNRVRKDLDYNSKIQLMGEEYFQGVRDGILAFRASNFISEEDLVKIERKVLNQIISEHQPFTFYSAN